MARAKQELAPRAGAEHSATVYGRKLGNRARALLDQAWDRLLAGDVKDRHGRDFVAALAQEMVEAPLSAIERTLRACPEEKEGDGRPLNIGQMFLQAVMAANAPPAVPGDQARVVIEGSVSDAPSETEW